MKPVPISVLHRSLPVLRGLRWLFFRLHFHGRLLDAVTMAIARAEPNRNADLEDAIREACRKQGIDITSLARCESAPDKSADCSADPDPTHACNATELQPYQKKVLEDYETGRLTLFRRRP